jgi:hypothetical protein
LLRPQSISLKSLARATRNSSIVPSRRVSCQATNHDRDPLRSRAALTKSDQGVEVVGGKNLSRVWVRNADRSDLTRAACLGSPLLGRSILVGGEGRRRKGRSIFRRLGTFQAVHGTVRHGRPRRRRGPGTANLAISVSHLALEQPTRNSAKVAAARRWRSP